ncbi:11454_t:CDS:2, partial [Funneliformis geosporum]
KGCAETYAIKYFLTKFFLIPTTDELDPDVTKDTEHLNRKADEDQIIKGKYDEFDQPLTEPGLAALMDEYESEDEEDE